MPNWVILLIFFSLIFIFWEIYRSLKPGAEFIMVPQGRKNLLGGIAGVLIGLITLTVFFSGTLVVNFLKEKEALQGEEPEIIKDNLPPPPMAVYFPPAPKISEIND